LNAVAAATGAPSGSFTVAGGGTDPNAGNNSSSAGFTVQKPPPGPTAQGTPQGTVLVNGEPFTGGTIPYGATVTLEPGASLTIVTDSGEMHFYPPSGDITKFVLGQTTASPRSLVLRQSPKVRLVVVRLVGGNFKVCGSPRSLEKKKGPVRSVWGHGKGHYRTTGHYSSATVRGTWWLTQDYCNGTRTFVRTGVVAVRDLVKKKTVLVRAGHSYFAYAKKH
jgi:hypothetical protein